MGLINDGRFVSHVVWKDPGGRESDELKGFAAGISLLAENFVPGIADGMRRRFEAKPVGLRRWLRA
jgi:hypothetical protein